MERNSELCSLPRNGSEWNFENLHLFCFHGTEFRVMFSSVIGFGTELCEFASIFGSRNGIPGYFLFSGKVRNGIPRFSAPQNNRNSVGNNHLFRLFRLPRNYFLSEIPNPRCTWTYFDFSSLRCSWTCIHDRGMCAAPGHVYTLSPELHLDVTNPQGPVLLNVCSLRLLE
jgi:hypothetical protein